MDTHSYIAAIFDRFVDIGIYLPNGFLHSNIQSIRIYLRVAYYYVQIVYILDQVRALENEMVDSINKQGLQIIPQIIVVLFLISYTSPTVKIIAQSCANNTIYLLLN